MQAVKTILYIILGLENGPSRAIQKAESRLAIVPKNDKQVAQLIEKADTLKIVLAETVKKLEV